MANNHPRSLRTTHGVIAVQKLATLVSSTSGWLPRNWTFVLAKGLPMIRSSLIALALIAVAAPAFAADATCSTADPSKFQPTTKLEDMLKTQGLTVRQIKTEKGCYEVYAVDKTGKKINNAYNAETLQQVANAEAGEG